jgi:alkylation response protein AidB-like acyl-CoA dehydrogenase
MTRAIFDEDHETFREMVRRFCEQEIAPHTEQWEADGIVPREVWKQAGATGLIGIDFPVEHGGGGVDDYRYYAIISEELARVGEGGFGLPAHNDIILPYFRKLADEEQAARWFPGLCSGELISAIAMTEPGTGSDLAGIAATAIRQDDGSYLLNGAKTFITNGIHADLVVVAAKTDPAAKHEGLSLLVVERGMEGFERGRKLDKIGLPAQDTAELFFNDVVVPRGNLLGEEGKGFLYLVQNLAQERLLVAVQAAAAVERMLRLTLDYVTKREAFGRPIGTFQNTRFEMAEMQTLSTVLRTFVDECVRKHVEEELPVEEAAMAKWWSTDVANDVASRCLQLHGGYGYMTEYPISRMWRDTRVASIYAGTNEIMKEIVGRSMGL